MNPPGTDPRIKGEIPEIHAKRVVSDMLEFLNNETTRLDPLLRHAMKQPIGGNPVAQRRFIQRVRDVRSPAVIDLQTYLGKRCKFGLSITLWDTETDKGGGAIVWHFLATADGPGTEKRTSGPIWRMTNHALVRLVQRSGATDAVKLLNAMRALGGPVLDAMSRVHLAAGDKQVLYVEFEGGTAVVEWPLDAALAQVKTVLAQDMAVPLPGLH